jgi:3-oxoacyl-[acyl-carrier protein] reductase
MSERRVALVTGGSRGIGAATCRTLAARGVAVGLTYRESDGKAAEVVEELQREGARAVALRFDLDGPSEAPRLVDETVAALGGINSLILNAGVWRGGRLETMDVETWWSVICTNLRGAQQVVVAALPTLRRAKLPSITVMSSAVGLIGFPGDTAYASVKAAFIGFARSLAKETASDGIRVNVLAPGLIETDMTRNVSSTAREAIAGEIVLKRFGTPDEVAKAAVFLSEDATYCTGTVLTVDGGWTI